MATSASLPRDVFSPQMQPTWSPSAERAWPGDQKGPRRWRRDQAGPGRRRCALLPTPLPAAAWRGFQRGGRELRRGGSAAAVGANTGFFEKAPTEPRPHSCGSRRD